MNIEIIIDQNTPSRNELALAIQKELTVLEVGDVKPITNTEEKGKLDIGPETVLIILKIAELSFKVIRAVVGIIKDLVEKHKIEKKADLKKPCVTVIIRGKKKHLLALPVSEKKIKEFLNSISKEEN